MQKPIVPIKIPALSVNLANVKFLCSGKKLHELCGQMGHLMCFSGAKKAQLSHIIGLAVIRIVTNKARWSAYATTL